MKSAFKYVVNKFKESPYFRGNSYSINLFLFLGAVTFVLFTIDIGSQIAVDNNEIGVIVAVLSNSIQGLVLIDLNLFNLQASETETPSSYNSILYFNEFTNYPKDRSPPLTLV